MFGRDHLVQMNVSNSGRSVVFFLAMHFLCEIGTLEGYCGLETTACLARKINIIYISCSFLCIVLSWRAVGTVEGKWQRPCQAPWCDERLLRAWHEERPQRVTLLFSDVKKADHLPIAFIYSTGRAPPCRIHMGRHSSSIKCFSARAQASCPGKLIFCILTISFMNILPDLLNDVATNYLSAIERKTFPDFFNSSRQWVFCAFSFPISFPPLRYHVHMDRQTTFTVPPYIPKEQPTYATCGQPIWKSLQTQDGAARWGGETAFAFGCMPVHEIEPVSLYRVFSLSTFDYLTALLKITLERWKEGNSEVPYSVCFWPAGPLSVQTHCSQALEGDMG